MKSKKGMYFTILTIAFLTIFLFIFVAHNYHRLSDDMLAIEMRVDATNDFIKNLNRDVERGLYISSYRAILSLEGYIISKGKFLNDSELCLKEAMINGTLFGENLSLMKDDATTLPDWINNIKRESRRLNINTEITVGNITVYQKDPWKITVGANYTLFVNDSAGLASWKRQEYTETDISIEGFEDPLYIVFGLGRITNVINRTDFENNYTFKVDETWNMTHLLAHIENSLYAANPNAPSFLARFEYNLSPSEYGIESFVDLSKLSSQSLDINDGASIIDYHYFPDDGNGDYRINFTPQWVKIDNEHRARYNVTSVSYPIG